MYLEEGKREGESKSVSKSGLELLWTLPTGVLFFFDSVVYMQAGLPGAEMLASASVVSTGLRCPPGVADGLECVHAYNGTSTIRGGSGGRGGRSFLPIIAVAGVVPIGIAVAFWWCRQRQNDSGLRVHIVHMGSKRGCACA